MRFLAFLLGVSIALSPLTATRFTTGLGVTDIMLAVSVVAVVIGSQFLTRPEQATRIPYRANLLLLYQFWLLSILLLLGSTGYSVVIFGGDYFVTLLQLIPYLLVALLVFGMFAISSYEQHVRALFDGFLGASLAINLIYIVFIITDQKDYFMDYRFLGLSDNPNQVASQALAVIIVGLVYPLLFPATTRNKTRLAYVIAGLGAFVGFVTAADTFILAFAFLAVGYGAVLYLKLARSHAFNAVLIAFIAILCLAYFSQDLVDRFEPMITSLRSQKSEGNQDLVRFTLWQNGIQAGMASPIIGNGAGAWSGLLGPFGQTEAHNSFIDWFSIVGGLGLFLWAHALARFFLRLRFSQPEPFIFFATLIIFSMFHYVFRHPFFWLAIAACVLVSGSASNAAVRLRLWRRPGLEFRGKI